MSQAGSFGIGGITPSMVVETLTGNSGGAVGPTANNINVVGSGVITVTGNPGTSTLTITSSAIGVVDGDTGSASGSPLHIITGNATLNSGSSILFSASGSTVTLNVTDASNNTIIGRGSGGTLITTANSNTGMGLDAFQSLTSGISNVAIGTVALVSISSGSYNTAVGQGALDGISSGNFNTAIGYHAGSGYVTGTEKSNITIGYGNGGTSGQSNVLRIGVGTGTSDGQLNQAFICGIDGVNVGSVARVVTEASDQLGTAVITAGTGITVTPGANTITIAATGTTTLNYVQVNHATGAPYVVLATDDYISCDSSGGTITINMPNAPATGRVLIVKDRTASASTNNITVTTVGGAINIDGATTFVMNTNYEAAQFIFNGTTYEVF